MFLTSNGIVLVDGDCAKLFLRKDDSFVLTKSQDLADQILSFHMVGEAAIVVARGNPDMIRPICPGPFGSPMYQTIYQQPLRCGNVELFKGKFVAALAAIPPGFDGLVITPRSGWISVFPKAIVSVEPGLNVYHSVDGVNYTHCRNTGVGGFTVVSFATERIIVFQRIHLIYIYDISSDTITQSHWNLYGHSFFQWREILLAADLQSIITVDSEKRTPLNLPETCARTVKVFNDLVVFEDDFDIHASTDLRNWRTFTGASKASHIGHEVLAYQNGLPVVIHCFGVTSYKSPKDRAVLAATRRLGLVFILFTNVASYLQR